MSGEGGPASPKRSTASRDAPAEPLTSGRRTSANSRGGSGTYQGRRAPHRAGEPFRDEGDPGSRRRTVDPGTPAAGPQGSARVQLLLECRGNGHQPSELRHDANKRLEELSPFEIRRPFHHDILESTPILEGPMDGDRSRRSATAGRPAACGRSRPSAVAAHSIPSPGLGPFRPARPSAKEEARGGHT